MAQAVDAVLLRLEGRRASPGSRARRSRRRPSGQVCRRARRGSRRRAGRPGASSLRRWADDRRDQPARPRVAVRVLAHASRRAAAAAGTRRPRPSAAATRRSPAPTAAIGVSSIDMVASYGSLDGIVRAARVCCAGERAVAIHARKLCGAPSRAVQICGRADRPERRSREDGRVIGVLEGFGIIAVVILAGYLLERLGGDRPGRAPGAQPLRLLRRVAVPALHRARRPPTPGCCCPRCWSCPPARPPRWCSSRCSSAASSGTARPPRPWSPRSRRAT